MYHEKECPRHWRLALLVLFLVLALPNTGLPELSSAEAQVALAAVESGRDSAYLAQGSVALAPQENISTPAPLAVWALATLGRLLPMTEFVVRLPSILAMGVLALLCGWVSHRSAGVHAGAIAAAAVIGSVATLRLGLSGEPAMLYALLINAAWLVWYLLSREQHRWLYAWSAGLLLVFLAVLTNGMSALFAFYFPLFMLRRPLKVRRRMLHADHLLPFGLLLIALVGWALLTPGAGEALLGGLRSFSPEGSFATYLLRLVRFPLLAAAGFLPWLFLVWPAYCVAFQPLEKDPALARFLRTICVSLFLFFWLVPLANANVLLLLVGPMAILCGSNYELLVRRYGRQLHLLPRAICALAFVGALAACGYAWWQTPTVYLLDSESMLAAGVLLLIALSAGLLLVRRAVDAPIWLLVAMSVAVGQLTYAATFKVHAHDLRFGKRDRKRPG
jgi:4-amino-4-deoxy-L-arabinose transferase-like glycosyltransferase